MWAYAKGEVLHHASHSTKPVHHVVGSVLALLARIQHLGDAAVGVNLHGRQVVKAIYQSRVLAELLVKGI